MISERKKCWLVKYLGIPHFVWKAVSLVSQDKRIAGNPMRMAPQEGCSHHRPWLVDGTTDPTSVLGAVYGIVSFTLRRVSLGVVRSKLVAVAQLATVSSGGDGWACSGAPGKLSALSPRT
jgi:hypothetical protein